MKRSARIGICFFMFLIGLCVFAEGAQARPHKTANLENIENFWDGYMAGHMKGTSITAANVAIVKDGELIFAKGYGYSEIENKVRVDPDKSIFRVGSISKLFTYTAIMQLYEKGLLDLDADVNQYLKGYQIPDSFDAPVTIRELMSHSAGFEASLLGGFFNRSVDEVTPMVQSLNDFTPKRVRTSGVAASYSNFGATVLGRVVESISGQAFSDYIDEYIYAPLNMEYSSFIEPLKVGRNENMVKAYSGIIGDKKELEFEYIGSWAAAGSMSSSATDMAKFMLAHLSNGSSSMLSSETLQLMHSTAFTMHPNMAGMAHGFYEVDYNGYHALSHAGATSYFLSDLFLIPQENLGIFYSVTDGNGYVRIHEPFQAFMDNFYPRQEAPTPILTSYDSEKYSGTFRYLRNNVSTVEKFMSISSLAEISSNDDGSLYVSSGGRVKIFKPIGDDFFEGLNGNERLAFVKTSEGKYDLAQLSSIPYNTMQRITWFSRPSVAYVIIGFAALMALLSLRGAWLVVREFKTMPSVVLWANVSNIIMAICTLSFIAYAYWAIKNLDELSLVYDYFPPSIKVAMLMATGLVLIIGFHGYVYGRYVMEATIPNLKKLIFGINYVSVLALVWLCHYWNFIGLRY